MSGKHEEPSSIRNQQNVVVKFKGSVFANEGGSLEETALAAEYVCHNSCNYTAYSSTMVSEFFIAQLVNDNAAIVGMIPSSSSSSSYGHMGVVTSMAVTDDGTKYISYYDPAEDGLTTLSFSSFSLVHKNNISM